MDISGKTAPLPPIPNKPAPIKDAQAINDDLVFSPVEETSALSEIKPSPNDSQAKAESSLRASSSHLNDGRSTMDALQNRFNPAIDNQKVTAENAVERYESSKEGSSDQASQKLDQIV
jgi:hypothetical protein